MIWQMPDLDLLIATKQRMRAFGNGDPVALWRADNAATNAGILLICCRNSRELSPNLGDGLRDQAAAVWDCEDAGLAATSIPSVNLTP